MSKNRIPWVAMVVLGFGLLFAAVVGLWGFFLGTAKPLHPEPKDVPSVAHSAPSAQWASAVKQGQALARATLLEQNLPGLSIAVAVDRDIVWAEGFGSADLGTHELDFTGQLALDAIARDENRVGVTPDTKFRIVGVSMALTSAAVGLLLEQNRLKLDDDIQMYVPAFPKKQWPVTLRQLMAHQGGIENDAGDEAPLETRCDQTTDGLQFANFAEHPLLFEPGTRNAYSTLGWVLVSAAVEAASGQPFFAFMRSQIFQPLGMDNTMPESWKTPIENRATFYHPRFAADPRYGPDLVLGGDHSCFAGGGAFLSTASDLVRFGIAINDDKLLKRATVNTLQAAQPLASGKETDWALGWKLETIQLAGKPARLVRQDDRRSVGAATTFLTFPERGLVVAVISNITFADTSSVALAIAEVFAERETSATR